MIVTGRVLLLVVTAALLAFAATSAAPAAQADTFTVETTTSDLGDTNPGNGDCQADISEPSCTLRAAIEETNALPGADRVNVPGGDYHLFSGVVLTISSDLDIIGASARTVTVRQTTDIDTGEGTDRVFDVQSAASVTLSRMTITQGRADSTNNHFGGNIRSFGRLRLRRVTVTGGEGNSAGGVANVGGVLTVENSTIRGNTAPADPGAGGDAGGILNIGIAQGDAASLTIESSTISGNTARLVGGVFSYNHGGNQVTIRNSTIASNDSGNRGGGGGLGINSGTATLENTIVSDNTSPSDPTHPNCSASGVGAIGSLGHNLESAFECGFNVSGDIQGADPLLGRLANNGGETNTHELGSGSPAIDRANDAACLGVDQRDFFRPQGSHCDIGAYELDQPPETTITSGPSGPTNDNTPTFDFSANEPVGATFQCRVDAEPFAPCTSPLTTTLTDGPHAVEVQAQDTTGNLDPTPATRSFMVDTRPPETTILSGPAGLTTDSTPTFVFSSDEEGSTFECSLDDGPFAACASPFTTAALSSGRHTFLVRAIDPSGNIDPSPALGFDTTAALREFTLIGAQAGPPALGESFNVEVASGEVYVSVPAVTGVARARPAQAAPGYESPIKGRVFVPLEEVRQLPVGSFVDTRFGSSRLTSARNRRGRTQAGRFSAGVFQVLQSRNRRAKGLTELRLKGSSFDRCRTRRADASTAQLSRRTIRRLRGNANGNFRTRGRHSAATVRGTIWITADRCDGTLTTVKRGKVAVRDLRRKRTITVRAGKSYLARAPG